MSGHARGSPAYRRLTLAMLFAGFSTFSLLYAVQPLLPLFARAYRLDAATASLAVSAGTGPLALAILVTGGVSERWGRRPVMVAGMVAGALATLAGAMMPGWHALLGVRVLAGVALAGVPAVAMAYVAEEVAGPDVSAAMGLYIAGSALGGMGGRLIAGMVAGAADWRWALVAVGTVGLAMGEAFRRLAPPSARFEPAPRRPGWRLVLRDPVLLLLFGEAFVLMGTFVCVYNFAAFRLLAAPYALSQTAVSAVFLLYLAGSASAAWFGALAGRLGRTRVLAWPVLVLLAGLALSLATPLPLVIAGIALVTVGFFGAHAIASAWVGARATARGQGTAAYLFSYYAGSSLLGTAGGVAWGWAKWPGVVGFGGVLGLLALAGAIALRRLAPDQSRASTNATRSATAARGRSTSV